MHDSWNLRDYVSSHFFYLTFGGNFSNGKWETELNIVDLLKQLDYILITNDIYVFNNKLLTRV